MEYPFWVTSQVMKQTFLVKLWIFGQTHASGNFGLGCKTISLLHIQISHTLHMTCMATVEPVLCVGFVLPLSSDYTHILKFIIIFFVRKPKYIRLVTCLPQSYLIQIPGPAEFGQNWAKRLQQSRQQQKDYVRKRDRSEDYVRRRDDETKEKQPRQQQKDYTREDGTEEKRNDLDNKKGRSFNFQLLCSPGFPHCLTPDQSDCRARGSNNYQQYFTCPPARR